MREAASVASKEEGAEALVGLLSLLCLLAAVGQTPQREECQGGVLEIVMRGDGKEETQ